MRRSTIPASTVASDELIAQRDEHDGEFGDGRFGEPAAAGQGGAGVESQAESEKVRMSNTELSRPKTIMKVRMDRRFQVRGRSSCLGSTLPGQQPGSAGAGDKPLAGGPSSPGGAPVENAVSAATAGSGGQIVIAGAGYAGLHVALRLTVKLRNNPKIQLTWPTGGSCLSCSSGAARASRRLPVGEQGRAGPGGRPGQGSRAGAGVITGCRKCLALCSWVGARGYRGHCPLAMPAISRVRKRRRLHPGRRAGPWGKRRFLAEQKRA
jgi:hypothetical protein